ncbi:zinc-binding dehydrogenase [Rhodococcus sp. IEGM 1408]|uniref:zinc-binding dehydrogenase n=1 Tax=Rhodococcus sp. IEGM 1408 TaxID=3082220 RepID=UPI00295425D0|nr:zinc-binding dehydrogenase [Rhodococcus sp. IEGM 1408]MDV8002289.1 zinc-binding dehydrogenase [Rhodococcus sp. IEGM 1408]
MTPAGNRKATAHVWTGGTGFETRLVPFPELGPGEALAAVRCSTVCGSDVHTVTGRRSGPCPSILGHESVGEIVELHPDGATDLQGDPLAVGDRVAWGVTCACGDCDRCRAGRSAKCRSLLKTGHEPIDGPWPLSGGYASHVHLRRGLAVARVPAGVGDGPAATAACAGATIMACFDAAGAESGALGGARVLITGLGMLGVSAVAAARWYGAAGVQVVDPDPDRVAVARRFGATAERDGGREAAPDTERADGPVDVAVELSGTTAGITTCLDALDVGGTVVLAGSVAPSAPVPVDPERIVRGLHRVVGVHNYEPVHLDRALRMLADTRGRLPWESLVDGPRLMSEVAAVASGAAPAAAGRLRVALRPGD